MKHPLFRLAPGFRLCGSLAAIAMILAPALAAPAPATQSTAAASRPDLVKIFAAVRDLRQPHIIDGIPDYTPAAVDEQKRSLRALRSRFDALDPSAWPVRDQVPLELTRWEMTGNGENAKRMLADRSAMPQPSRPGHDQKDERSAAQTYAAYCADCHGANLEGAQGPALRNVRWTQGDSQQALTKQIRDGSPNRGMPAWGAALAATDIAALARFIGAESARQPTTSDGVAGGAVHSNLHDIRIEPIVEQGIRQPKSLAVLADGRLLVTDEKGLRVVENGALAAEPMAGVPAHDSLEEIVARADRSTAGQGWLYMTYLCSKACGHESRHVYTLTRGHLRDGRWTDNQTLFNFGDGDSSYGVSKITFDDKGHVYFTLSGAEHPGQDPADLDAEMVRPQDLGSYRGKVLRVDEDGRIPADNPFVHKPGALPAIWSYGHRGLSGLSFDGVRGTLWATEHGPWGGDELNRIRGGRNYGWPVVSFGYHYVGKRIEAAQKAGMEPPVFHWTPSIGVSNVVAYDGAAFPKWRGHLLVGSLGARIGRTLYRFELKDDAALLYAYPSDAQGRVLRDTTGTALPRVPRYEEVVPDIGRIRDMRIGPEGYIYLLLEHPDRIVRLVPAPQGGAR